LDDFEKNYCAAITLSVTARRSVYCGDGWQPLAFRRSRMAQRDSLRAGTDGTVGFKWICAEPLCLESGMSQFLSIHSFALRRAYASASLLVRKIALN
jgi:hypothetical protein